MNTHTPNKYELLINAVGRNDLTAVKSLVQHIKVVPGYALSAAIEHNWVDQIAVLAPKCDRNTIGQGLRTIMVRRFVTTQMIHELLPYTDQRMRNLAIADACDMRRADIVDVLYPLCDISKVVSVLDKYSGPHIEVWKTTLQQRWDDEKLRQTLIQEVFSPTVASSRKM